jgi:phosphatidylglycerophosphatase A
VISHWFGCGLVPGAPGTAGTIGALPVYWAVSGYGPVGVAAAAALATIVGIWASSHAARISGLKDPQFVCVDEVAGVLVTWTCAPTGYKGTIAGFLLFRLLDWLKPFPADACERLPGGYGIVLDDVVAGLWGALALLALHATGWL